MKSDISDDHDGRPNYEVSAPKSITDSLSPLQIHVHGHRVLVGTFVSIAMLVNITIIFLQGVELKTLNTADLSDDRRSNILDRYNSYSGFIASMVSIPFQQLPAMLLPVFFLCFKTHAAMAEHKSFVMTWGPVLSVAVASYLLGLGLSSLNVQFDAPKIRFNMAATDLKAKQADTSSFSRVTYITNTVDLAGVPSTDTILRNAIVPSIKVSDSACTDPSNPFSHKPEASIEFGFTLNPWLDSLLPNSIPPSKSFKFSMSDDFTNQPIDVSRFPTSDLRKSALLLTAVFFAVFEHFTVAGPLFSQYSYYMAPSVEKNMESPDFESLLTNTQSMITNASNIIDMVDKEWEDRFKETNLWHSIASSDITVELSNFQLSPQILFEAVTFELPVRTYLMEDWLKDGIIHLCTDIGCIIDTPNFAGTNNQDQVQLIPLCSRENEGEFDTILSDDGGCATNISNSSVLVFSFARYVATSEASLDLDNDTLTFQNPRTMFQVTVGRLSWTTDDLTKIYDSTCDEGVNCRGLYFPLSDGKRHLVLGEEHISAPKSGDYFYALAWQTLVLANTQINDTTQGDVVIYNLTAESAASCDCIRISDYNCSVLASNYVNNVVQRHLYSKDSVQPAYLAALFWIFQGAAVRDVLTEKASTSSGVQLLFDGNLSWTSAYAAIPMISACATFAGCGIIVILALLVTCESRNQQRQASLTHHIAAHNVNAVLADESQFPPLLESVRVKQQGKTNDVEGTQSSAPIERFEFIQTTMTLQIDWICPCTKSRLEVAVLNRIYSRQSTT